MMTRPPLMSTRPPTGNIVARGRNAPFQALSRSSGEVFCARRGSYATVSVIRRQGRTGAIRYVQWCSLRGAEASCPEDCILEPPPVPLEPAAQAKPCPESPAGQTWAR